MANDKKQAESAATKRPERVKLTAEESLKRMHSAIAQAVGADQIQSVAAIGPSDWKGHVKSFFNVTEFVSTDNYASGVDVTVDGKAVSGPAASNAVVGVWSSTDRPKLEVQGVSATAAKTKRHKKHAKKAIDSG